MKFVVRISLDFCFDSAQSVPFEKTHKGGRT